MAAKKGAGKHKVVPTIDFEEIVVDLPAVEQLDRDYFAYGQQVIEDRAVPSAADGLKFGAAAAAPPPAIPPTLPGGAAPLPMALPPHAATEGAAPQPVVPRSRPPANAAR